MAVKIDFGHYLTKNRIFSRIRIYIETALAHLAGVLFE
jgi:hypothetical protein